VLQKPLVQSLSVLQVEQMAPVTVPVVPDVPVVLELDELELVVPVVEVAVVLLLVVVDVVLLVPVVDVADAVVEVVAVVPVVVDAVVPVVVDADVPVVVLTVVAVVPVVVDAVVDAVVWLDSQRWLLVLQVWPPEMLQQPAWGVAQSESATQPRAQTFNPPSVGVAHHHAVDPPCWLWQDASSVQPVGVPQTPLAVSQTSPVAHWELSVHAAQTPDTQPWPLGQVAPLEQAVPVTHAPLLQISPVWHWLSALQGPQ